MGCFSTNTHQNKACWIYMHSIDFMQAFYSYTQIDFAGFTLHACFRYGLNGESNGLI